MNGLNSDNKTNLAFLAIIYPSQKKCGLVFINPLMAFDSSNVNVEKNGNLNSTNLLPIFTKIIKHKVTHFINFDERYPLALINFIGGIRVFFDPELLKYESDLFHRERGLQYLYGEEVLDTFKIKNLEDPLAYINRLNVQESLLLSFYDSFLANPKEIRSDWMKVLRKNFETNLNDAELGTLFNFLSTNKLHFSIIEIPGEPSTNDMGYTSLKFKEESFRHLFDKFEYNIISDSFKEHELAKVEILNGTEVNGLARKMKAILNEKGYKIFSAENAGFSNQKNTVIIDRSGNTEFSQRMSQILKIPNVYHSIKRNFNLDTTILLGEDVEHTR